MFTALILLCLCPALYYAFPLLAGRCYRIALRRKCVRHKNIVLTFDDGPGSRMTPAILSLLAEYNAKASFFIVGSMINDREAIVKRIAAEGHEICSHGYEHVNHWKTSPFRCLSDIKRGWQAIDAALGIDRGKYAFRPPYGKLNLVSLLYLLLRKVPIVLWTVEAGDRTMSKTNPMTLKNLDTQHVALEVKKTKGAVVLFHDSDRRNSDTESFTLESIRSMLATSDEMGMRVITISQLLNYD